MNDSTEPPKKTITAEMIDHALTQSVHVSFKTTNSNIPAGGIRLSRSQALDLPYVSARTLLADGVDIPVDYQANSGPMATIFKAIKVVTILPETLEDGQQQQIDQIKAKLAALADVGFKAGTEQVNIRMRQILVPDPIMQPKPYISLSPITATGLCYLINQAVDANNEALKAVPVALKADYAFKRLFTAHVGIGGSNPQNVGSWVRDMQRPLLMSAPKYQNDLRAALRIFYKGFEWFLPYKLMLEYQDVVTASLKNAQRKGHDPDIKDNILKLRQREKIMVKRLLSYVLKQAHEQQQILITHQSKLPSTNDQPQESAWLSNGVGLVQRGLIDPEYRHDEWKKEFAKQLAKYIVGYTKKTDQGERVRMLGMESEAIAFVRQKIIAELNVS